MTTPTIKVKVVRKPVLKLKVLPRFPANVYATSPILLDRTGGNYTFSLDATALEVTFGGIYQPLSPGLSAILNDVTIVTGNSSVAALTRAIAVQRTSPTLTTLMLPTVASQMGLDLDILDWSSSVTDHEIRCTPNGSETIMKVGSWSGFSNSAQLTSFRLRPSVKLNGWYIAP